MIGTIITIQISKNFQRKERLCVRAEIPGAVPVQHDISLEDVDLEELKGMPVSSLIETVALNIGLEEERLEEVDRVEKADRKRANDELAAIGEPGQSEKAIQQERDRQESEKGEEA